jgi:hypothetical protein
VSWEKKREVFEKGYEEVLAAIKHQDDKLNRTLTAIAFLTAAGVALFAEVASRLEPPVRFPASDWDVTSFLFLIFVAGVVLGLAVTLAAIGPSQALPRLRGKSPEEPREWPSLIFFAEIARDDAWPDYVARDEAWLAECLTRNLHGETKRLAHRVEYKMARSREAAALVQMAVLSLSLLGVFSIERFSVETRWWFASALLLAILLMPLWDRAQMLHHRFYERANVEGRRWSYALARWTVFLAAILLVTAPALDTHWWALVYALAAILATRLAYVDDRVVPILWLPVLGGPVVMLLAWLL